MNDTHAEIVYALRLLGITINTKLEWHMQNDNISIKVLECIVVYLTDRYILYLPECYLPYLVLSYYHALITDALLWRHTNMNLLNYQKKYKNVLCELYSKQTTIQILNNFVIY